jgi:hypothetical protein
LVSGVLIAGAVPLAAQSSAPMPPPRVTDQIVKDESGKFRLLTEEYTIPAITVPVSELSIADLYAVSDGQSGPIEPTTMTYRCPIDEAGKINLSVCIFVSREAPQSPIAERLVLRAGNRITLPTFPKVTQSDKNRIARHALLELHVPAVELPVVDLATGLLVERALIPELAGDLPLRLTYPPRALRQAVEGTSVIECQVQQDLSLICHQIGFEPASGAALFARESQRAFGSLRVSPQLADGTDARGVRFRLSFVWRIT